MKQTVRVLQINDVKIFSVKRPHIEKETFKGLSFKMKI